MGTRSAYTTRLPGTQTRRVRPTYEALVEASEIVKGGPVDTVTRGILFFKRTRKIGSPRAARRAAFALLRRSLQKKAVRPA